MESILEWHGSRNRSSAYVQRTPIRLRDWGNEKRGEHSTKITRVPTIKISTGKKTVNPLDNLGGNTKLTGSNRLGDNTNSSSAIGDNGRVALGVGGSVIGANIGPVQVGVQAGVQATADSGAVMDAGAAVTSAVITDTKQYVQDLKESSTCTGTTCAIPH